MNDTKYLLRMISNIASNLDTAWPLTFAPTDGWY